MQPPPETRETLLLRVRNPNDRAAWDEFVQLYRPVIYRVAVARGLQDADALDLVQTVFVAIARSIGTWEKSHPSAKFRHWLIRVARNATINALTRRPPDQARATPSHADLLNEHPEPDGETGSMIDWEYRRQIYAQAAGMVRKEVQEVTWRAFEMTAVDGVAIEVAAEELGKSIGVIYAARSRVMKRLSSLVQEITRSYQ